MAPKKYIVVVEHAKTGAMSRWRTNDKKATMQSWAKAYSKHNPKDKIRIIQHMKVKPRTKAAPRRRTTSGFDGLW